MPKKSNEQNLDNNFDLDALLPQGLKLFMRSRNKVFFDGDVTTLTSVNETGEFDVLPMHANFITMVKDYLLIDKGLPTEQKVDIVKQAAVLSVQGNKVDVYVGL